MNKRIALLFLVAVIVFSTLACIGSGEVSGDGAESASQAGFFSLAETASTNSSVYATATSAAQEFHIQLTLTAPISTPNVP
jgi:hypothetical protein